MHCFQGVVLNLDGPKERKQLKTDKSVRFALDGPQFLVSSHFLTSPLWMKKGEKSGRKKSANVSLNTYLSQQPYEMNYVISIFRKLRIGEGDIYH